MTIRQIEKVRYFLDKLKEIGNLQAMEEYISEVRGYYLNDFDIRLKVYTFNTRDSYTKDYFLQDSAKIKNYLEQKIDNDANASRVFEILNLIDEGKSCSNDTKKIEEFVVKIYHSYCGEIKFNDVVKAIATQHGVPVMQVYKADDTILEGVISKLRQYADTICSKKQEIQLSQPNTVFNISNMANAQSSSELHLSITQSIEYAKQQAEDAGLPDEQYRTLIEKLCELEKIGKSKESKGKRWQKAKEVMKWLVEQGIQVAGIVIPVLSTCLQ